MSDIEAIWEDRLRELNLAEARFLSQPGVGPVRRNYLLGGRVYKMRLLRVPSDSEHPEGDLEREYELVRRCAGMRAIPEALDYRRTDDVEVAAYRQVRARPLTEERLNVIESFAAIMKVAGVALRLAWRGIAHNDLMPRNVLVSLRGQVYLIDFDQAAVVSRWEALYRNFLRGREEVGFYGSIRSLVDEQLRKSLPSPFAEAYIGLVDRRLLHERWIHRGERGLEEGKLPHAARCAVSAITYAPLRRDGWRLLGRVLRSGRRAADMPVSEGPTTAEPRKLRNDAAA